MTHILQPVLCIHPGPLFDYQQEQFLNNPWRHECRNGQHGSRRVGQQLFVLSGNNPPGPPLQRRLQTAEELDPDDRIGQSRKVTEIGSNFCLILLCLSGRPDTSEKRWTSPKKSGICLIVSEAWQGPCRPVSELCLNSSHGFLSGILHSYYELV